MSELHFPWLDLAVLVPGLGAIFVHRVRDPEKAWKYCLVISVVSLLLAVAAWQDFVSLHTLAAHDRWDFWHALIGFDLLVIDQLSAPLIPLAALCYFVTELATPRAKARRFSFSWALCSQSILLATLACRDPWCVAGFLVLGTIPPWVELRRRGKSTRVYAIHMGLFACLILAGMLLGGSRPPVEVPLLSVVLIMAAVLLRSGTVPTHCWIRDLFENASFGTALLFVTPMVGAYAAMRLLLPIAPDWVLFSVSLLSLVTACYAACMALVQHDARHFFSYLLLSHSSLVLVGLEIATPLGLTGALCVWLSVSLALTGFGVTLRCVEAREGRLSLDRFNGLYENTPALGAFFLLTGLASIGFPGTIGFIGLEILVEGAGQSSHLVGALVVVTAALNGLAVMQAYFRVFTGSQHATTIPLRSRLPERVAVLVMSLLILGGGVYPQPGVDSRYHAAMELAADRAETRAAGPTGEEEVARLDRQGNVASAAQ